MTRDDVSRIVQQVLSSTVQMTGRSAPTMSENIHLLSELGLTSLEVLDVTIGLSDGLGIAEFPMLEWFSAESRRQDANALTVGSLVDACMPLTNQAVPSALDSKVRFARSTSTVVWIMLTLTLGAGVVAAFAASR